MKFFLKIGRYINFTPGIILAIILLTVGAFAVSDTFFKVEPHEVALVLLLGEPISVVGPGLQTKFPFIEGVHVCDLRVQSLELPAVEAQISDLTRIRIVAKMFYHVDDCLGLYLTTGSEDNLKARLEAVLNLELREIFGRYSSTDLSTKRNEVVAEVKTKLKVSTQELGVIMNKFNLSYSKI